jgi:hypothetical protein
MMNKLCSVNSTLVTTALDLIIHLVMPLSCFMMLIDTTREPADLEVKQEADPIC